MSISNCDAGELIQRLQMASFSDGGGRRLLYLDDAKLAVEDQQECPDDPIPMIVTVARRRSEDDIVHEIYTTRMAIDREYQRAGRHLPPRPWIFFVTLQEYEQLRSRYDHLGMDGEAEIAGFTLRIR